MSYAVRTCPTILATIMAVIHANAASVVVDSATALEESVRQASPGDEILIAAGTYEGWRATLAGQGTPEKPIVIRPETTGKTILTGETNLHITGSHLVLDGLRFQNCTMNRESILTLQDASHCRITNCQFENTRGRRIVIAFRGKASDNRIDHCALRNTVGRPLVIYVSDSHLPKRNRIDHNLFEDVPPKDGNGRETIQIGQNQPAYGALEPNTIVEYNVFRRCNGEGEIISNKSSRNTFRGNILEDCRGAMVMRGGSHCLIEGNLFVRCNGGIRLHGTHHRVIDNTIIEPKGVGIVLPYGMQRPLGSLYQATGHCLIAHNTIVGAGSAGIYIGSNRDRDLLYTGSGRKRTWNYDKHGDLTVLAEAPYQNRIVNNIVTGKAGKLIHVDGSPDNTIAANLLHAQGDAVVGTSGENALAAPPQFVSPNSGDYSLRATSPAHELELVPLDGVTQPEHAGARGTTPTAGPGDSERRRD